MYESTLPVTAATQDYAAPDDVIRIHRITFTPSASLSDQNTYTLEYRGFMEMDQIWGINQQWPCLLPLYYTLWGQPGTGTLTIKTFPVPSEPGNLHVYYFPEITALPTPRTM